MRDIIDLCDLGQICGLHRMFVRGDWSILVCVDRVISLPPSLSGLAWQLIVVPSSLKVARELRKVGSKEMRRTEFLRHSIGRRSI